MMGRSFRVAQNNSELSGLCIASKKIQLNVVSFKYFLSVLNVVKYDNQPCESLPVPLGHMHTLLILKRQV